MKRQEVLAFSFAFDFKKKEQVAEFIKKRFQYGLLFYPAGDKTLRFRLNLSFTESDMIFLFEGSMALLMR